MFKMKNLGVGALNALISFPAMVVVTTVLGFNLANAFLFAGIGTLIFHAITKNSIPVVLGVSGSYIAVMLSIATTVGQEYLTGGVICAGITYIILGLISLKWQKQLLSFFPKWMLSFAIVLIGLSLLPIGQGLAVENILVASVALGVAALCSMSKNKYLNMFSMGAGLVAGIVTFWISGGQFVAADINSSVNIVLNIKFELAACLQMVLLTIVVFSEMLGDVKNTSDIIGKDLYEEVGLGRIAIGNGLAQIVSGAFGNNAYTTYSENIGALLVIKYYDAWAQVWTALIFIGMSFFTPLFTLVSYIPMAAFGGILLFLYGLVTLNATYNLTKLHITFREVSIMGVMLAVSYLPVVLMGVPISGTAIGLIVGVILNKVIRNTSSVEEVSADFI